MKIARVLLAVALASAGFTGIYWIAERQPLAFGLNETPVKQALPVIAYGYAITLVGVILGSAYRELQARRARGETQITNLGGFVRDVFHSIDFWLSACASPIVYALLWKSLEGGSIAALTIVALQNGFCCTIIIERILKSGPAAEHPARPESFQG